ncbi:MAG: tetratricopeptide repeat protein [Anaerolineales bacterium]
MEYMQAGKAAYEEKDYRRAAQAFEQAAQAFAAAGQEAEAAEARNNQSVALLMAGDAEGALRAVEGTPHIFAQHNDREREGMAWGNQATALEELGRLEEAIQAYRRAVQCFEQIGKDDLRIEIEKAIAAIHLKQGRLMDAGMEMLSTLQRPNLPWWQRLLRWMLRIRL